MTGKIARHLERFIGWLTAGLGHDRVSAVTVREVAAWRDHIAAEGIDAMDLLHTGRFEGFCPVSSDSDFTRLAARIRESGLTVYGFGERKTLSRSWRPATATPSSPT